MSVVSHPNARSLVIVLANAGAWLSLAGCTTTVVPPQAPDEPQVVYVLDHGWHSSLVLPGPNGSALVRYEYGDWNWLVHERRGVGAVFGALFRQSPAALGRRELPGPPPETVGVPIQHLHAIEVPGGLVRSLRESLEGIYRSYPDRPIEMPAYQLDFVRHPAPYTLAHNSNRVVAEWLERLGCRVDGPKRWSTWALRAPDR